MQWLKSFLSRTASAQRRCRLGLLVVLTLMMGTAPGRGATRDCGPNSTPEVLRLDRRAAKKLLLSANKPSYPALARINYIGGHVRLLVTVDCHGRVESIHVLRGHPFLAIAALDAIRRWVYHPFQTASGPAAFETLVDVDFSLVGPNFTVAKIPPEPDEFLARSVHPPHLVNKPQPKGAMASARLRVLVSKKGRVVDATLLSGSQAQFTAARKAIAHWRFRPARWGNMSVPWYVDVDVPVAKGKQSTGGAQ